MHAITILHMSLYLLAGLVTAAPAATNSAAIGSRAAAGGHCCAGGANDSTGSCAKQKLNAFCCVDQSDSNGRGCDKNLNFPTGRNVQLVAGGSCSVSDILEGTGRSINGFVGCA
ncbi:hypothetical protein LZ31DRAFT_636831 [Colletotrichum somersetense]|nr:hypothetical protein LZ31DRAFT_636831 [Colletotrichum somersetense]